MRQETFKVWDLVQLILKICTFEFMPCEKRSRSIAAVVWAEHGGGFIDYISKPRNVVEVAVCLLPKWFPWIYRSYQWDCSQLARYDIGLQINVITKVILFVSNGPHFDHVGVYLEQLYIRNKYTSMHNRNQFHEHRYSNSMKTGLAVIASLAIIPQPTFMHGTMWQLPWHVYFFF